MNILTEKNKVLDTNTIGHQSYYSVLRFKDTKNPDFFMEYMNQIDVFVSPAIMLEIGAFSMIMPLHWSILCSDMEHIQSIPLYDINGRSYSVFCMNPIDGYMPHYLQLRQREIFPQYTWTAPRMEDKDMLVVPMGVIGTKESDLKRGPLCAMFSANRLDVCRPISDIL